LTTPVYLEHDWFPQPLPDNVLVGEGTWIFSSYVFLHYRSEQPCGLKIGHDSGIYIGSFLDLGPRAEVEVGNYCALAGPIISTDGRVTIGDYSFISYHVVIADSWLARPPDDHGVTMGETAGRPEIHIGENVWIGTRAVILPGARIGEGAVVGAQAVVDFEVPPYAIVAGNPARIVGDARSKRRSGGQS